MKGIKEADAVDNLNNNDPTSSFESGDGILLCPSESFRSSKYKIQLINLLLPQANLQISC